MWQVPPDSYFPDFDEDDLNPDERMHGKQNPWAFGIELYQWASVHQSFHEERSINENENENWTVKTEIWEKETPCVPIYSRHLSSFLIL